MHIILAVLGVAGTVALLLWRIRMAAEFTGELVEAGNDVRLFFRRLRWRRKVNRDLLKSVTDPREAASAMMVAVARDDGAITEQEKGKILELMEQHFEMDRPEAEEFLARAQWLARDMVHLAQFLRRLTPAIDRYCTKNERQDLVAMLMSVASVGDSADEAQLHAIKQLSRRLS